MASMFDQYNKSLKREEPPTNYSTVNNNMMTSSGYVSLRPNKEIPIFSKQKMNLALPKDITHVVVSNGWLLMLMSNQVLFRLNLEQPNLQDEVELEQFTGGLKISEIFIDPLGAHLLIALTPNAKKDGITLIYLNRKTKKPKRFERFKDEITSVGFNFNNTSENSTGPILLGSSKGLIFETECGVDNEKPYQIWKQIFDIGRGENVPITGIEFHTIPETFDYIILVTTLNRLYKFHETVKPERLQNVFNSYLNIPEDIGNFQEISSQLKYSKLRFSYDSVTKFPSYFGWLVEPGIFSGKIDPTKKLNYIVSNEIIPYPTQHSELEFTKQFDNIPISFVMTDFHALLLYPDHVTAVSMLNYQTVYEEYFTEDYGKLLNIVKDTRSDAIYAYSSRCIFRYKITNEQRNVWRMYADKNEFEMAKNYCQDNVANLDMVLVKQAEMLFRQKDYKQSAEIYSETAQSSFEGVCLKFLEINENEALMTFLKNRLNKLKPKETTQITMLVVWMVELYLTEMARFADDSKRVGQLQKEFDFFMNLKIVVECMKNNRSVIYDLMASHGDNHNLTLLTTVNKDFESVVNQHINQNKFEDALAVIRSQNKRELYYKYCPILMEDIPKETITAIIHQGKRLDPVKLLPTLVCLDSPTHINEVIRYLEFCIFSSGCSDQSTHNFLIKLYGELGKKEKLMDYLENQGMDVTMIHYDVHYALRICGEHKINEACVFLQCLLEQWHTAVELALTFNTELAKRKASQPIDRELRRKLWLKIAEHEIHGKDNVSEALQLLKECDELLRIEDLLPFFSDFQKIDDFKEAICEALKEYNMKIVEQRNEMEDSAKSAERVRNDLQTFRNRSVTVGAQEQCAVCSVYLLLKPFFIFPCGHKFHGDCLEKQMIPLLNIETNRRLSSLKLALASMNSVQSDENNGISNALSQRDKIKMEIENILASDCLFCGELMINSIDQPFIEDPNRMENDWN